MTCEVFARYGDAAVIWARPRHILARFLVLCERCAPAKAEEVAIHRAPHQAWDRQTLRRLPANGLHVRRRGHREVACTL